MDVFASVALIKSKTVQLYVMQKSNGKFVNGSASTTQKFEAYDTKTRFLRLAKWQKCSEKDTILTLTNFEYSLRYC